MALDWKTQYPGGFDTADADYPQGIPRNVSAPGAGDGSPWEAALVKDILGFLAKIIKDGSVTPSGNPDTAVASDYLDALEVILLSRSELASEGGDILVTGNRLSRDHKDGLRFTWDSGVLLTVAPGEARDLANASDLVLPASLQKDISLTWVEGAGGGLPDGLTLTANTWYRVFLVAKPDGTADITFDPNSTVNFFLDANAITAGFSDNTLFRRIGWVRTDGGTTIPKFYNLASDTNRFLWDVAVRDITGLSVADVSRSTMVITSAPPSTLAILNFYIHHLNTAAEYLITQADQTDTAAGLANFTTRVIGGERDAEIRGTWELNSGQQLFVRTVAAGTPGNFDAMTDGWIDNAIVA